MRELRTNLIFILLLFFMVGFCFWKVLAESYDIQGNLNVKGKITFMRDLVHTDTYPTNLKFTTATDTRNITFPNASGEVSLLGQTIGNAELDTGIDALKIGAGDVDNTEFSFLNGVTSGIQGQINGKEPTISAGSTGQYWRWDKTWANLNLSALSDVFGETWQQGDILYVDSDLKFHRLAAGTSGWFLKAQGAAANPIWASIPGGGDMLKSTYDLDDDGKPDTAEDLAIPSQAAGDILYFNGSNWVRLAKDVGKYLKSDTTPAWDTPPGSGTVTGTGTAGMLAMWTDTGEIGDASSNDTDVADAVSKKHDQQHAITSSSDHTSSATPSQILMADANGLPVDSSFTDTEMRTRHFRFPIPGPDTLTDTTIFIAKLDAAITVTNLHVSCLINPDTEIAGDLKYCDDEITMANPVVINDFDTTDGARNDNSITSAAVAATKCIYIDFDATPIAAIKEIFFDITYTID